MLVKYIRRCLLQGGRILATSPWVLAWVYTKDSLLIKDILRDYGIFIQYKYAFGVVYGEVLYLEFYSVFSEPFIIDEILLCKILLKVRLPVKM